MSALQQVLECEDLRGLIREYQPPHPVAKIIENEYLYCYEDKVWKDAKKIVKSIRLIIEEKNYEEEEKKLSKGIPVLAGSEVKSVHYSFEKDAPTENYCHINERCGFKLVIWTFKKLRYAQEGLGLKYYPTLKEIFTFKQDENFHNFKTNIDGAIQFENYNIENKIHFNKNYTNMLNDIPFRKMVEFEEFDEYLQLYKSFSKIVIDDYRVINNDLIPTIEDYEHFDWVDFDDESDEDN